MTKQNSNTSLLELPTEKTPPSMTADRAKVLLYGYPKVGKTTLAAGIDPDRTLFLATEPGLGAQDVYQVRVDSWDDYRGAVRALQADADSDTPRFSTVVVDTVDELVKMCAGDKLGSLGVDHPTDLNHGKGWNLIGDQFRAGVRALANLGYGLWLISHARDREINTAVGRRTRIEPTITGQIRQFVNGFVDLTLYAQLVEEQRCLRTRSAEDYEAGGRVLLPDPLPLDASALREALADACQTITDTKEEEA